MKKIQMVDVVSQYEKHADVINEKILNVIKSGCYIQGLEVENFENELSNYLNSKYTISCANGTDALYVALMSLDFNVGDEILVPSFTFVSTVETICLLGLKPVFIDIHPDTFLLNESLIKNLISNRTRAIIPVHLFGQCCDMSHLKKVSKKYNLFIIEDAAQSIGSQYFFNNSNAKFSGTIGDIGITSFYPSKNLGCFGDGGAIFTQSKKLSNKIRLLVNHGQHKKYHYDIIGLNSRLDAIQASVLSFKLKHLAQFNRQRQDSAVYYDDLLKNIDWIKIPKRQPSSNHVYHQYSILLSDDIKRDTFQKYLSNQGIPTMIYYPIPIHKQRAYSVYSKNKLPVSEMVSKKILSLPMHSELTREQQDYIFNTIKKY